MIGLGSDKNASTHNEYILICDQNKKTASTYFEQILIEDQNKKTASTYYEQILIGDQNKKNASTYYEQIPIEDQNKKMSSKYHKILTLLTFFCVFQMYIPDQQQHENWSANKIFDDSANEKRDSRSNACHIVGMFLFLFSHHLRAMFLWQHEYDGDTECIMFSSSPSTDQIRCA